MVKPPSSVSGLIGVVLMYAAPAFAQNTGAIRGVVYDKDAAVPLAAAQVLLVETGARVTSTATGEYGFPQVLPGTYQLTFSKEGYIQQVKDRVEVVAAQVTSADVSLASDVMDIPEVVVQDRQVSGGSEAALLNLRRESPQFMDSVSGETMSKAGAGDAAEAMQLITGTSVQEGKFAVVRGLPDRYVNAQMNGVRLPTADADKRAVQLDQFPSKVIESIQVSKTFTPDQQGDASGGAVNVVLKGIPNDTIWEGSLGVGFNTQVTGRSDFLTYKSGGVNVLGIDGDGRDIPPGRMFGGTVGVSRGDAPLDYNVSMSAGGKLHLDHGVKAGGFASLFYKRDSAFHSDGIEDKLWVFKPGEPLTPQRTIGSDIRTALFDVTEGRQEVQWGALGAVGMETDNHSLTLLYMYTRTAEDSATLLEDTRGKQFFFPGYDPDRLDTPGHEEPFVAPYLRLETLKYTERTTQTLQLYGRHTLPLPAFGAKNAFMLLPPEVDWTVAWNSATLAQPDKRQFGSYWLPRRIFPGGFEVPATHSVLKPDENFNLGNLQRIFQDITEDGEQYFVNVKLPFEQWSGDKGYLKLGVFHDQVKRAYNQDTFSNFGEGTSLRFEAPFRDFFSRAYPNLDNAVPVTPSDIDVDYKGEQDIAAWYFMADLPLTRFLKVIGGLRFEKTKISIINDGESGAVWLASDGDRLSLPMLSPGDADVAFQQYDTLPSIGFVFTPIAPLTLRGAYTKTVARQTFKELSPVQRQEYLGGDVFFGNPALQMSALENYDLRLDYTPYSGSLLSISWFRKNVKNPIEYEQAYLTFLFTRAVNYPKGRLSGFELEVRQHLGQFWQALEGLSLQANATFIDSKVQLPDNLVARFASPALLVPTTSRDMVNTPAYLYNLGMTYDLQRTGTQVALFYTVRGDTLVAGAGLGTASGFFIPDVYATEFGTLNLSLAQKIGKHLKVKFSAENLTNPEIKEVYRSKFVPGGDRTKTSYQKGLDFTLSLSTQ